MRPPCGLRDPYNKLARSAPSPLWGEGWGEGNMRLRWWFRSPYVLHFSASRVTRERARGARRHPPWLPRLPAKKIAASRCPQLIPSGFRVGHQPASLQAMPLGASLRLAPACGQRFGDFQPDSRSLTLLSRLNVARVLIPPCHVHGLCNAMFC